jgi:hypothetical protein
MADAAESSTILRRLPDPSTVTAGRLEGTPNLIIKPECVPEPSVTSAVAERLEVSRRAGTPASVVEVAAAAKFTVEGEDDRCCH